MLAHLTEALRGSISMGMSRLLKQGEMLIRIGRDVGTDLQAGRTQIQVRQPSLASCSAVSALGCCTFASSSSMCMPLSFSLSSRLRSKPAGGAECNSSVHGTPELSSDALSCTSGLHVTLHGMAP